jgi:serine/threonine protein kinase/Tol biopolymer transport system component
VAIQPGTRLGTYEVTSHIGSGGMGEVYQAHDTKLGRDVAIKVLPDKFARDFERLARFQREAKLLASLNHPNIATIHGLEQSGDTHYLVMELVPGETLRDRILREGALPITEALTIGKQIAEALEAAHNSEKSIIHRDLKPANVKVTPEGRVKVLDFGLAKAFVAEPSTEDISNSPTLSALPTMQGVILGTAAYMSPEQACGKPVDKRTDIWALGCVLYELLSGKQAFPGQNTTEVLADVVKAEPDWRILPSFTPVEIRGLLQRCLRKDSLRRLRDVGDARIEIDDALAAASSGEQASSADARSRLRRTPLWAGVAVLSFVVAVSGIALWSLRRPSPAAPGIPIRTTISLPEDQELVLNDDNGAYTLGISPDGKSLVYAARQAGRSQLYLRPLDQFEARLLPGSDGARYPFFSPDGQWVAFFAEGKLQKVSVMGGEPLTICEVPPVGRGGGSWGPDDMIVFSAGSPPGLWQVSGGGGAPKALTEPDGARGEPGHFWPQFLPSGKNVLFSIGPTGPGGLAVLSLETGKWRRILATQAKQARYVSTGHLLYAQEGALRAVAFDLGKAEPVGSPVPVLDPIFDAPNAGGTFFALSQNGTLAYVPGGTEYSLVSVDRQGRVMPLTQERQGYRFPQLSPDGKRVAVTIDPSDQGNSNIWVYDIERGTQTRLTVAGHSIVSDWRPDGTRLAISSSKAGSMNLFLQPADASGNAEQLLSRPANDYPDSWSPDGRFLAFEEDNPNTGADLWMLYVVDHTASPFLVTASNESQSTFSADGHWLAYRSDESGRDEIYVRPFPGPGGEQQISSEGGSYPVWSRNGKELFYRRGPEVFAVAVDTQRGLAAGKPQLLFEGRSLLGSGADQSFDVFPDGQHFLMIKSALEQGTQINIVVNWFEELKRRMPTGTK